MACSRSGFGSDPIAGRLSEGLARPSEEFPGPFPAEEGGYTSSAGPSLHPPPGGAEAPSSPGQPDVKAGFCRVPTELFHGNFPSFVRIYQNSNEMPAFAPRGALPVPPSYPLFQGIFYFLSWGKGLFCPFFRTECRPCGKRWFCCPDNGTYLLVK